MGDVVVAIQKVTEIVNAISSASQEQASGVAQVGEAVTQMDQVTQQNAGASEEMSATSEELAAQAEELQSSIAFFRVDSSATKAAANDATPDTPKTPRG
mgnify:CR=1 FL=1